MDPTLLKTILTDAAQDLGISHFGWTPLERPLSFEFYRQWIAQGHHGEMGYLERHLPDKENPSARFPRAKTALVFAFPYRPHPAPRATPLKVSRIASYAMGADYHHWLKGKLLTLIDLLKIQSPDAHFEVHTDSSPLLERDLANRAGLGWIGKNTCSIHPKNGSFFLIGEILTSFNLKAEFAPLPDFCGKCQKCIEVCPTQALTSPRVLEATKCISYLSIESRKVPPLELRKPWGDWLFGCDLCQTVCPWNQKPFRPNDDEKLQLQTDNGDVHILVSELRWIFNSSGKTLEKSLQGTAMARAGSFGLKRNAMLVAANRKLSELKPDIEKYQGHEKLGELATWALQQLNR